MFKGVILSWLLCEDSSLARCRGQFSPFDVGGFLLSMLLWKSSMMKTLLLEDDVAYVVAVAERTVDDPTLLPAPMGRCC